MYGRTNGRSVFCVSADWICTSLNTARTCGGCGSEGDSCTGPSSFPDVTIGGHESISGGSAVQNDC